MRLRVPERLTITDVILWGLRIAIVTFVIVGSFLTLSQGLLGPERWPRSHRQRPIRRAASTP